jgi:formylglycine-generating enzyme required for sulfatase activity
MAAFRVSLGAPAPLLMAGLGLISGALSAWLDFPLVPGWLGGVGKVFFLDPMLVPVGAAFALAVAAGLTFLSGRVLVLPVVALATMYAWSAATITLTTILSTEDYLRLALGSLAAGAVGAAATHLGGALLLKELRRLGALALTTALGAVLGLIYAAPREVVGIWPLFLLWQPAVAFSLGRALARAGGFPTWRRTWALAPVKHYLTASRMLEAAGRQKARRVQAVIYTLLLGIIAGLVAFINQEFLKEQYQWRLVMGPSVLTDELEREKTSKPGSDFKECTNGCPTLIVVPAGKFTMGSPETEKDRSEDEGPQHEVTIAKPFAVGKTDVTFAEWDICAAAGACPKVLDNAWGRNDRPVILVNWDEAKGYVTWLKRMTGKDYRLLTESEWEYAARASNQGRYTFGDDETQLRDYAWYAENSEGKTQPVGSKKPNAFDDMHGNVWQWVEDCYHDGYEGAPSDGSAWIAKCGEGGRVIRGGSWSSGPQGLRSADRLGSSAGNRVDYLGFRVGRMLTP